MYIFMNDYEKQEFRNYFLELLWHDKEIQDKISDLASPCTEQSEIISQETLNNLQNELAELQNKNRELEKRFEQVQQENQQLNNKLAELESKLAESEEMQKKLKNEIVTVENEKNSLEKDLTYYQDNFSALLHNYSLFKQLENSTAESFRSIINDSSPMAFLLSGADYEAVRLYFEKISMEWKKYDSCNLEILNSIFDFFFEQFRLNNPDYKRLNAETGQDFNLDLHTRTSDSMPVGKIRRIIINGYENGNKKIKSFVEIG